MRSSLLKKLGLVVLSLGLVGNLMACGGGSKTSSSSKTTTLTFWNGFTSTDGDVLKEIVKDYNKTNKDHVKINMDIMAWDNFNQKLPTAITAKKAPDFVAMNFSDMASYVDHGAMQEVGDFYNQKGVNKNDFQEQARKLGVIKGKTYFIPMQVQGMYLYWNKDLFKKAGLNPNKPPKTWDELAEMAPKLAENNVSGFIMPKDGSAILYNMILDNGGTILSKDQKKAEFSSSATKKVLDQLQKLIYKEKVGPKSISGAEADNLMLAGSLSIYINGPWLNAGLIKNQINYGITTLPQAKIGEKKAILDGVGFGIPASTPNAKKKAIYSFLKYWNSKKVGKKWSLRNKCAPYLKSVANDKEIKADPLVNTMYKQIQYAKPLYAGNKNMSSITSDIINPTIEQVLAGSDTRSTMKDTNKKIQSRITSGQ
ncbi:MAG: ABC transporter substrate-binding protein [Sporolactobacillus sp.]|jgi:multiple sugar transport system substrate-binding protein|nr:ABC transporter substrate-binding protein [Sporolactobacillus sp.]